MPSEAAAPSPLSLAAASRKESGDEASAVSELPSLVAGGIRENTLWSSARRSRVEARMLSVSSEIIAPLPAGAA